MSSPKQTAPITDEPTITTIPVGESATQQATSPETARHDAALAMATAEPTMAATPSTDAPIATASAYQADTPLNPTIAELPANSTPSAQPTTTTTTTTHLQLPQTTPSTSPPLETGLLAATDGPLPSTITTTTTTTSPSLSITLLLPTGARHPYTLDEKYLRSRNVSTELFDAITGAFDPRLLSGYQLKELIWIDWRAEWEARPANPSFIRLIVMGRLVEDKGVLKDYPLSLTTPNVVHMTVKPADLFDDDENTGGKNAKQGAGFRRGGSRGDPGSEEEGGAGCRCVIL